jgi:hypothetical protein
MIEDYFLGIEKTLALFDIIDKKIIEIQKIDDNFGIIKGIIICSEYKLDFIEVVQISLKTRNKVKYKYHFMDKENNLIFRYDNTKHHPLLQNFPHHKHIGNNVEASNEPDILNILKEIKDFLKILN